MEQTPNAQLQSDKKQNTQTLLEMQAPAIFSWTAPLYHQYERGLFWYIFTSLALLLLYFYAYYASNWSFALALTVMLAFYVKLNLKPVEIEKVQINEYGILEAREFYAFKKIKNFRMIKHQDGEQDLYINLNRTLHPQVRLFIREVDPEQVRAFLAAHIEEIPDQKETFLEEMIRKLKL
jgi:hypothetical protein